MTMEQLEEIKVLSGDENLTSDELNVLMDHDDEYSRKGNFSRVFPLSANVDYYEKLFEVKRYYNKLLWAYVRGTPNSTGVISKYIKRVYNSTL